MHKHQQPNHQFLFVRASARQRLWASLVCAVVAGLFGSLALAQHLGFDFGTLFGPCGFKQRHGLPCPTCGMTTAVLAFTRGEILSAFSQQPAAGLLCLALGAVGLAALAVALFGRYPQPLVQVLARVRLLYAWVGVGLLIVMGWAVTFLRAVYS